MEFSVDRYDFNGNQDLGLSRMVLALGPSPVCCQKVKSGIWLETNMFEKNAHFTPKSQGTEEGSGEQAWEVPLASDFYQLPSRASGSCTSSLNQGVARL